MAHKNKKGLSSFGKTKFKPKSKAFKSLKKDIKRGIVFRKFKKRKGGKK